MRGLALCLCLALSACAGEERVPARLSARAAAVLVEGCALTPWQSESLGAPASRRVLGEVVLLCPAVREGAALGPTGAEPRAALRAQVAALQAQGYRVSLGLSTRDETGVERSAALQALLGADDARARFVQELGALLTSSGAEGLWLHLPNLPAAQGPGLTRFVGELSAAVRPARRLALLAPPLSQVPSDIPDGDTLDLQALRGQVDQIVLLTLDYSDPDPGPITDSGWIRAVLAVAGQRAPGAALGFALPTYGIAHGAAPQQLSYLESVALAETQRAQILRGEGGGLSFAYEDHEVHFQDARSTLETLGRLEGTPGAVLYYSLGWEDPALWDELSRRVP